MIDVRRCWNCLQVIGNACTLKLKNGVHQNGFCVTFSTKQHKKSIENAYKFDVSTDARKLLLIFPVLHLLMDAQRGVKLL